MIDTTPRRVNVLVQSLRRRCLVGSFLKAGRASVTGSPLMRQSAHIGPDRSCPSNLVRVVLAASSRWASELAIAP
jgi:hypothetical protein